MEQLLKVTTMPFQAIHFTQSARLIPSDHVALERQKALARHQAFQSRYRAAVSSIDLEYINQVNTAFSKTRLPGQGAPANPSPSTVSLPGSGASLGKTAPSAAASTGGSSLASVSGMDAASVPPAVLDVSSGGGAAPVNISPAQTSAPYVPPVSESSSAYTVQRGSFELRVAKGELSYVPPLAMTIITQYPSVHFEYTGGFRYVPPRDDALGDYMNLSI